MSHNSFFTISIGQLNMQAPLVQAQQQNTTVEKAFQEAMNLNNAQNHIKYRHTIQTLTTAIQATIDSKTSRLTTSQGQNLINLITEQNIHKPVTKVDIFLAKYVYEAYNAFIDSNETYSYQSALGNVTTSLLDIKKSFSDNKAIPKEKIDIFTANLRKAREARPRTQNQDAINTASLFVLASLITTACILPWLIPGLGILIAATVVAGVAAGLLGHTAVSMYHKKPTIFNSRPKACQVANQAKNAMQQMKPSKS